MQEFETIDSSAWEKKYPYNIVGQIIKTGKKSYSIRLLYNKAGKKMVSEYPNAYKDLYEAEDACDSYVDKLLEELTDEDNE